MAGASTGRPVVPPLSGRRRTALSEATVLRMEALKDHPGQYYFDGKWRPQRTLKPGSRWHRVQRAVRVVAAMNAGWAARRAAVPRRSASAPLDDIDVDGSVESSGEDEMPEGDPFMGKGALPGGKGAETPMAVTGRADLVRGDQGDSARKLAGVALGFQSDSEDEGGDSDTETADVEESTWAGLCGPDSFAPEELAPREIGGPRPWYILLPSHPFVRFWDSFMLLPLLYVATVTPFRLFFVPNESSVGWVVMEWMITSVFTVDICLNFLTAFENGSGDVVVDPSRIALRYARSWLLIDLVATFPLDAVITSSDSGASANRLGRLARLPRAIRLVRLTRLLRLLRVAQLQGYLQRIESAGALHPAIARVIILFFWLVLLLSFLGGVWHFVGTLEEEDGRESWLTRLRERENVPDGNLPTFDAYLWSLYWAVTTMTTTGYGDIHPVTLAEVGVAISVQMISLVVSALIAASLLSVLTQADSLRAVLDEKKRTLESFVRAARLPNELRNVVSREFHRNMAQDASRASATSAAQEVLAVLSPAVRERVILHSNGRVLSLLPVLHTEPPSTQAAVLERLTRVSASKGDWVASEGTFARSLLFLARGSASLWRGSDRVATLTDGAVLGDIDILFSSTRLFSIRAETDCEMYAIGRDDLPRIIAEHVHFGVRLKEMSLARLRRWQRTLGKELVGEELLTRLRRMRVGVARLMPWLDSFAVPKGGTLDGLDAGIEATGSGMSGMDGMEGMGSGGASAAEAAAAYLSSPTTPSAASFSARKRGFDADDVSPSTRKRTGSGHRVGFAPSDRTASGRAHPTYESIARVAASEKDDDHLLARAAAAAVALDGQGPSLGPHQ